MFLRVVNPTSTVAGTLIGMALRSPPKHPLREEPGACSASDLQLLGIALEDKKCISLRQDHRRIAKPKLKEALVPRCPVADKPRKLSSLKLRQKECVVIAPDSLD